MANKIKHILIYIPHLDQRYGGLRQYSVNLLRTLTALDESAYKVSVLHNNNDPEILRVINEFPKFQLYDASRVTLHGFIRFRNAVGRKLSLISELFTGKRVLPWKRITAFDYFIQKENIHIIHCPYQDLPQTTNNVFSITTMHDVQELYFPSFFSAKERARRARKYPDFMERSHSVVVSYQHVKNDLVKFFDITLDKIEVALLPMGNLWFNHVVADKQSLEKFNLPEKFLLYPANSWPHKNHLGLLNAILNLKQSGINVNVVFSGSFKNEHGNTIQEFIKKNSLESQVKVLGIVDEVALLSLYKDSTGVVVPTLYEAGSFPLMESILLGVPVICANVTSLPETIGSPDFVFDPNDSTDMTKKIEKLYTDENYRNNSVKQTETMRSRLLDDRSLDVFKNIYERA